MGRSRSSTRKASARLRRAIKLGLVKRSDFPDRLDKKSQDRLRRLSKSADLVERLLDSGRYQKYFARSRTVSRALDSISPKGLRSRKLPFKLIPTGKHIEGNRLIPNRVKRVRVSGKRVEIETQHGEQVVHLRFSPTRLAHDPEGVIRETMALAAQFDRALIGTNTTKGMELDGHGPGVFPSWVHHKLNAYAPTTEDETLGWFQGFVVTGTPKKGKKNARLDRSGNRGASKTGGSKGKAGKARRSRGKKAARRSSKAR